MISDRATVVYIIPFLICILPMLILIVSYNGIATTLNTNNDNAKTTRNMLQEMGFRVPIGNLADTYTLERIDSFGIFVALAQKNDVSTIYENGWNFMFAVNETYAYYLCSLK